MPSPLRRVAQDGSGIAAAVETAGPACWDLAPFIWFAQRLRIGAVGRVQRPFLGSAYALLHQLEGASSLHREGRRHRLPEGGVALTQPGDELQVAAGACLEAVVFDLMPRQRRWRSGKGGQRQYIIPRDQPQPRWHELVGRSIPVLIAEDGIAGAIHLVGSLHRRYWIDPWQRLECQGELLAFLARYVRGLGARATAEPRLAVAERWMRGQKDRSQRVADVALALGISRSHLTRSMIREGGVGPGARLAAMRWDRARELLAQSDWTMQRIARACGYRSPSAFGVAFRRVHGLSPRQWRLRLRAR